MGGRTPRTLAAALAALAILLFAASAFVSAADVPLPPQVVGLPLERQVEELARALAQCQRFAERTHAENVTLQESVRQAERAIRLLDKDNRELRSMDAWHVLGLHGSGLHRVVQYGWAYIGTVVHALFGPQIAAIGGALGAFSRRVSHDWSAGVAAAVALLDGLKGRIRALLLWLGWHTMAEDMFVEFLASSVVGVALFAFVLVPVAYLFARVMTAHNRTTREEMRARIADALDRDGKLRADPDVRAAARMYAAAARGDDAVAMAAEH